MRNILRAALLVLVFSLSACGGIENPFSSDNNKMVGETYFDAFPDVPIPSDMNVDRDETSISVAPGGVKSGVTRVSGRVEVNSLTGVMGRSMQNSGWTLRSAFRSPRSVLVFEKPDRICTIYIEDGTFTTAMQIFVTMKLEGGDPGFNNTYSAPGGTSTGQTSGTMTGGTMSGGTGGSGGNAGSQPLTQ